MKVNGSTSNNAQGQGSRLSNPHFQSHGNRTFRALQPQNNPPAVTPQKRDVYMDDDEFQRPMRQMLDRSLISEKGTFLKDMRPRSRSQINSNNGVFISVTLIERLLQADSQRNMHARRAFSEEDLKNEIRQKIELEERNRGNNFNLYDDPEPESAPLSPPPHTQPSPPPHIQPKESNFEHFKKNQPKESKDHEQKFSSPSETDLISKNPNTRSEPVKEKNDNPPRQQPTDLPTGQQDLAQTTQPLSGQSEQSSKIEPDDQNVQNKQTPKQFVDPEIFVDPGTESVFKLGKQELNLNEARDYEALLEILAGAQLNKRAEQTELRQRVLEKSSAVDSLQSQSQSTAHIWEKSEKLAKNLKSKNL